MERITGPLARCTRLHGKGRIISELVPCSSGRLKPGPGRVRVLHDFHVLYLFLWILSNSRE